jgi:hypothetical protein
LTGFTLIHSSSESAPFVLKSETERRLPSVDNVVALENGTWTSLWTPKAAMPAAHYRQLAKAAGVHIFNNQDDAFYANKSVICLHARNRGPRLLRFPGKVAIRDPLSSEPRATSVEEWRQEFELGETQLLYWQED